MCTFCDIVNKKINSKIVYEDEIVCVFLDNDPISLGHLLVIPKTHYLDMDDIPDDIICHLTITAKKLVKVLKALFNPKGYSIMQNGGNFNDIGHYHLHIFPRYNDEEFKYVYSNQDIKVLDKTYSTIKEEIKKQFRNN